MCKPEVCDPKVPNPNITLKIFASGEIGICGATNSEQVYKTCRLWKAHVSRFKA